MKQAIDKLIYLVNKKILGYFNLWQALGLLILLSIIITTMTILFTTPSNEYIDLEENPLLITWDTPFQTPPFNKIKNEHFLPAIKEGIKQHAIEIESIITNPDTPTLYNTIESLEYSGKLLDEITSVFYNLRSSNTNDELQAISEKVSSLLSEHYNNISLNPALFARIRTVYEEKNNLNLNTEQLRLLDETFKYFIRSGAMLKSDEKVRFREINEQLSLFSLQFSDNTLKETNDFKLIIENEEDLDGLPQLAKDRAAEEAESMEQEGKWVFTLDNPSIWPFLQYADNRELREKIQTAYAMRGNRGNEFDNNEIISQTVSLRLERAKMLGYNNHAEYVLAESMAKDSQTVNDFLNKLWTPSIKLAQKEAIELQDMIIEEGGDFKLEPWDWWYYSEKIRQKKYNFNEENLRLYFELESVRSGIFTLTNKLFGIKFVKVEDVPIYHSDVEVYQVTENDGTHIGIIYLDLFPRENKRGGGWMSSYRNQSIQNGNFVYPIVTINGNFSKPVGEQPALLTFDDTLTLFHEFGHALHGLLSQVTYPSLSGTSVSRDFVELPSQIMENWASDPEFLKLYAKHYQTGETIPDELLTKMIESKLFNQGFINVEYLAASILDMDYHTYTKNEKIDVTDFENKSMARISLIPEIIPRYRSTYFTHTFSGGYSARYYSYRWAEVLDSDAYELFKEKGIFDRETADLYRKSILEKGNTADPMDLYIQFRGRKPDEAPFLKKRGLF